MTPPPDGGTTTPPPLECALARGFATCLDSFRVEPNTPFTLPVQFDGCGCCPATECSVLVDYAAERVDLTTGVCPDPCDCDGCNPIVGQCEIPPLRRGEWTVTNNGVAAFTLPVEYDAGLLPVPGGCATYAHDDRCIARSVLPGRPLPASAFSGTCAEPTYSPSGTNSLILTHECWSCDLVPGVCTATVEERLTDDLPPGSDIHLDPRTYFTGCIVSCDDACTRRELRCEVPPMVNGNYYQVFVGGDLIRQFLAGDPEIGCPWD